MHLSIAAQALLVALHFGTPPMPRAEPPPDEYALTPVVTDGRLERLHKVMDERIDLDYREAALGDVLKDISAKHKLNFHVDPYTRELHDDILVLPVTVHLTGVQLATALDLILNDHKLAWTARGEVIVVTTKDTASKILETQVFPITDLIEPIPQSPWLSSADSIIEVITSTVSPTTWGDVGGLGGIKYEPKTKSLVVSHEREVLEEVRALLEMLRKSRNTQLAEIATSHDDAGYVVVMYRLPKELQIAEELARWLRYGMPAQEEVRILKSTLGESLDSTKKLVELIPKIVEPKSWDINGGKGTISAVATDLVIKQTPALHVEIHKLLAAPPTTPGPLTVPLYR